MRITHAKLSALEPGSRGKRRVTICAELGTPNEFLNITVAVPSMGTELEVCQRGIERAKPHPTHPASGSHLAENRSALQKPTTHESLTN